MELTLPLYESTGVVVVESTLASCSLAIELAKQGQSVTLIGSGASPGREVALEYRAWWSERENSRLPPGLAKLYGEWTSDTGEQRLDLTNFTTGLEDELLDAGVSLLYNQVPAGVLWDRDHQLSGIVMAGKSGLIGIRSDWIVDASEAATILQVATGVCPPIYAGTGPVSTETSLVWYLDAAPEGVNEVSMGGVRGVGHGPWWEFTVPVAVDPSKAEWPGELAREARRSLFSFARDLRKLKGWEKVKWIRGADALTLPGLLEPPSQLPDRLTLLDPSGLAGSRRLSETGPGELWQSGIDCAEALTPVLQLRKEAGNRGGSEEDTSGWRAQTAPGSATQTPFPAGAELSAGDPDYPLNRHGNVSWGGEAETGHCAQVVVAGGGTSGMPAAAEAARLSLPTLLLEHFADVGGTNTVGGVPKYWYGRKTGYGQKHDRVLKEAAESGGLCPALAKLKILLESGVDVHLKSTLAGVLNRGRRIVGLFATSSRGLLFHSGEQFLDATGDGDIAAWAGNPYTYGSGRDESTLWYSFGKFIGGRPAASREYFASVDARHPDDLTESMIASRRRDGIYGRGDIPQFYLAPRESRHIQGRATVTYRDILRGKHWEDTVLVCRSNFDIKGPAEDDLILGGFVEPDFHRNFDASIPFRALQPIHFDNLLVLGKAYSITHDAFALARMQRDLIAMGAVAALACRLSPESDFSRVSTRTLQEEVIHAGVLEPEDLHPQSKLRPETYLEALDGGKLELLGQVYLLDNATELTPALLQRLEQFSDARQRDAARILYAGTGHPEAASVLLAHLDQALSHPELPDLHQLHGNHDCPDHGWAPWPCYLINLLAQRKEPELASRLPLLAERIHPDPSKSDKFYHYTESLARAGFALAGPDCVPVLQRVWKQPWIQDSLLPPGSDPRRRTDHVRDRYTALALLIARALHRCGHDDGTRGLVGFSNDSRSWVARTARLWLTEDK